MTQPSDKYFVPKLTFRCPKPFTKLFILKFFLKKAGYETGCRVKSVEKKLGEGNTPKY